MPHCLTPPNHQGPLGAARINALRGEGVTAPVYLSIASKCLEPSNAGTRRHSADNPVVRAQLALSSGDRNIRRGVNTDALLDRLDRRLPHRRRRRREGGAGLGGYSAGRENGGIPAE